MYQGQSSGFVAEVWMRGLSGQEVSELTGFTPADMGYTLRLLVHPLGPKFWGILVLEDERIPLRYGVRFRYFVAITSNLNEFALAASECYDKESGMNAFLEYTTPSCKEDADVTRLRSSFF